MEIEVKGHSGCKIDIVKENRKLFVYKTSRSVEYSSRLLKQAEKQRIASNKIFQHVRVPQIVDVSSKDNDGKAVIKMEYVYSRNFMDYFESAGFEQIEIFIQAMILYVNKELEESPLQTLRTSIVTEKYNDVENKILSNADLANNHNIRCILEKTRLRFNKFESLQEFTIPVGQCHGDLTLSNILFNGNNFYLIDFLDSFIESPLMDIIKLRQDSKYLWSQLMLQKKFDQLRLQIICEKIDREIDNYYLNCKWYRDYYEIFQLLNFLRILQYAKEGSVVAYLCDVIQSIIDDNKPSETLVKETRVEESESFNLIVPAAADYTDENEEIPEIFGLDDSGYMMCVKAITGLNLNAFTNIYITILRKHADLYGLEELFKIQFKRLGLNNAHLILLEHPTSSQSETIFATIHAAGVRGAIFIKDADGYFESEVTVENGVAVFPLEELSFLDPQHKSYVAVDDMYFITNMIERKVVSHLFNVGGSCFENVNDFLYYYNRLSSCHLPLCLSHIIYAMLLDNHKFRPILAKKYIDWGTHNMINYHILMNNGK